MGELAELILVRGLGVDPRLKAEMTKKEIFPSGSCLTKKRFFTTVTGFRHADTLSFVMLGLEPSIHIQAMCDSAPVSQSLRPSSQLQKIRFGCSFDSTSANRWYNC